MAPVPNIDAATDFAAAMAVAEETLDLHMRAALDETPAAGDDLYTRLDGFGGAIGGNRGAAAGRSPPAARSTSRARPRFLGPIGQVAGGHWGTRSAAHRDVAGKPGDRAGRLPEGVDRAQDAAGGNAGRLRGGYGGRGCALDAGEGGWGEGGQRLADTDWKNSREALIAA